ncbi:MAG: tryptophan synthase subunit alpha [Bacteroidaceae bacterium]
MNRINTLFQSDKKDLLSIYFCAGFPTLEGTVNVLETLEKNGVSMVEIGIPYSDPMADGAVIQDAAVQALHNGMTLKKLFAQLVNIRDTVSIPLLLMGYLNPVMRFGFENFCKKCQECGVDGAILPDLPFKDYHEKYKAIADKYDVRIIMLITPETSEDRIHYIDDNTDGFIYMVSSAAITGAQQSFGDVKLAYFKRINAMKLRNPRMVGFGISNHETFEAATSNARGGIIGSRFVTLLKDYEGDVQKAITHLKEDLK